MDTNYNPEGYPATPPVSRSHPNQKWLGVTAAVLLSLGAGIAVGSSGTETVTVETRVEVPGPERVVTKDVPGPERVVTITKTPASCLTALDLAENGFELASSGFGFSADGWRSASEGNAAGMNQSVAGMNGVVAKMKVLAPKWQSARDACRAGK